MMSFVIIVRLFVVCLVSSCVAFIAWNMFVMSWKCDHADKKQKSLSSVFKRQLTNNFPRTPPFLMTPNVSVAQADDTYYRLISRLDVTCHDNIRLGNADDGGWNMCVSEPFNFKEPCLVYSFGINWDFSFDDAVSKRFQCTVRAYDPSMNNVTATLRRDDNIWFYKVGLGGSNRQQKNGWTIMTLKSIIDHNNDSGKIIDYMKIDIEGHEWDSLNAMLTDGILKNVKQLAVEFHTFHKTFKDSSALYYRLNILRQLEEIGFRRWYWHFNHVCAFHFEISNRIRSSCYEVVYVNANYVSM
jgi:hypothetical protein